MQLTELLNNVHTVQVTGKIPGREVNKIAHDSRKVERDSVFVAVKGYKTDGHKFILDAINKGAFAVVLEEDGAVPDDIFIQNTVAKILVNNSRRALAELSTAFYGNVSKKMTLIGITGTNGKTTIAYYLKNILESSGKKVGMLGTIENYICGKVEESSLTTPESNDLNELLAKMYNEGCGYVVMEVSSHSLALDRIYGLDFKYGVFTNFTSDHLDFHGTLKNYFSAKKIFFNSLSRESVCVYNADDKSGEEMIEGTKAKCISYGTSENANFKMKDISYDLKGTNFSIEYKDKTYPVSTALVGDFNAYNACAAFAVSVLLGLPVQVCTKGIETTSHVPGRFEVIGKGNKKVIVDYSHTADSLEKALRAVAKISDGKPVYTVFGCGGGRDKSKRPEMGRIAASLSKEAIVTTDNPRDENPTAIIEEIIDGIKSKNFKVIENREEAIRYAIDSTEEDAVILIAGKGHETYQEINGVKHHFSDKEIAEKYLNQ